MLYCRHLVYISTIVNTFYGGIIWVWVCQMGEKVATMTTGEKILNFSKIQILGIQSDLKEARG